MFIIGNLVNYYWSVRKKDLEEVLNHLFNNLIVCGYDFNKSPEFHKKKIIKDLHYMNSFSFKNFGVCIRFICRTITFCECKDCERRECVPINIEIIEISPFLFLTKKEKIDFNNFLKFFKKFDKDISENIFEKNQRFMIGEVAKLIFERKNNDFLLNLDDDISKVNYGYNILKKSIKLNGDFFEMTLFLKSNKKKLEKIFQNFFKDFEILSVYNFRTFEKIRIPKRFLKSSMRINFKFNKLPMQIQIFKFDEENKSKNLEMDFGIVFGVLFERDIREANENRKKLFNKHFKELKKLSNDIYLKGNFQDYFINTLFDEDGLKLKKNN